MSEKQGQAGFIKGFFQFAVGPLGSAIISFLTTPVTTWLVAPEEFGKATMFTLVQTLTTSFLYLGMEYAYAREYHEHGDKRRVFINALLFPLVLALVLAAAVLVLQEPAAHYLFQTDQRVLVYLYCLWLPFTVLETLLLLDVRMKERGWAFSLFNIGLRLSILFFTISFLLLFSRTYVSIVAAAVLGQVLVDVLLLLYCRRVLVIRRGDLDRQILRNLFQFGLPWIPATMIGWVLVSSDRLFLQRYTGYEEVGVYFAAFRIIGLAGLMQGIFISYWSPVSYRWQKEGVAEERFVLVGRALMLIMGLLFFFMLFTKKLFVLLLAPEYGGAAFIIPFLLLYPVMNAVGVATTVGISFSRRTHYNIWIALAAASSNVLLNLLLVPRIGAIGASMATGLSYVIFFWLRTLISRALWHPFSVAYYVVMTLLFVSGAAVNVLLTGLAVYAVNTVLLALMLLYSRDLVKRGWRYGRGLLLGRLKRTAG